MLPMIFSGNDILDDMFDSFDHVFGNGVNKINALTTSMKTDVKETDSSFELDVNMPGYKKEDIKMSVKDGYLTISASTSKNDDKKDEDGKYIRKERSYGSCSRSFYVGEDISKEDVKAKLEDGILHISVPKKEPVKKEEDFFIDIE
jgi:HSP20 family molecular chaperone IbpA